MSTEGFGASRAGGDDFHNEDAFAVHDALGLYVVCDGAGDRPGGETAASAGVAALESWLEESRESVDDWLRDGAQSAVQRALRHALEQVHALDDGRPERAGMATTATLLLARGHRGVIGHVGDSRAYLFRRGRLHLLTRDQEWTDPLTGVPDSIQIFSLELDAGDRVVLCTDGAEEVVNDPALVRGASDLSPALLASRIVSAANRKNPSQDATVVVVKVRGDEERGGLDLSLPSGGESFRHRVLSRG